MRRFGTFLFAWTAYLAGSLEWRAVVMRGRVDREAVLQAAVSGVLTCAVFALCAAHLRRRARRSAISAPGA